MKMIFALLVVLLTIPASRAFSQAECNSGFEACMNSCGSKGPESQSSCILSCQDKNNQCSARYYGAPPQADNAPQPSAAAVDNAESARDEAPKPRKKASRRQ